MTTMVPIVTKTKELHALITKAMPAIQGMLPKHITPERMFRLLRAAVTTTPKLTECKSISVIGAMVECSRLGLEPNGPLGHAYLIPFRDKRRGETRCQLILGYKGLLDLARRSGQVTNIYAHAAYSQDHFDYELGDKPFVKHKPSTADDRGTLTHVYAVAYLRDSPFAQIDVMTRADVEKIRRRAPGGESEVWRDFYDEMAKKTVLRRLCKILPQNVEFASAIGLEDQAVHGAQTFDAEFTLAEDPELQKMDKPNAELSEEEQARLKMLRQQAEELKRKAEGIASPHSAEDTSPVANEDTSSPGDRDLL